MADGGKKKKVMIQIDEPLYRKVQHHCLDHGIPASGFIGQLAEEAVQAELAKHEDK